MWNVTEEPEPLEELEDEVDPGEGQQGQNGASPVSAATKARRSSSLNGALGDGQGSAGQVCRSNTQSMRHISSRGVVIGSRAPQLHIDLYVKSSCSHRSPSPHSWRWLLQEDEEGDGQEDDVLEEAQQAVGKAAGGLRGLFGTATRKSKAVIEVRPACDVT